VNNNIKKINKIWMYVVLALAAVSVVLAVVFINLNVSGKPQYDNKLSTPALICLIIALYTVVNSILCVNTNMTYGSPKFEKKFIVWAILNTFLGCIPVGIMLITEFVNRIKNKVSVRKKYEEKQNSLAEEVANSEGYHAEDKVIVRLVSNKRHRKEYKITGLEDTGSKNNWKGWLYLAPVIILIGVFLLYPLVNTIIIAFTKGYNYSTNTGDGFTLENFGIIFGISSYTSTAGQIGRETAFVKYAVPNTLIITFVTVPVSIFLALIIAVALNSIKWFKKTLQTIFFLPYVTNTIAIGMVFSVIFDKQGIINSIFGLKAANGVDPFAWIYGAKPSIAMIPLCIYIVWNSIPFKILILLSGLQNVDKQYYQAAQIDAAPKHKVLFRITVPLLSPQILYLMITSFIGAFKEYTSIVAIFKGPSTKGLNSPVHDMLTIVYYVYENITAQTSFAAAGAVFLFVVILIFTFVQFGVSSKRVHY
jgi:multiple sugar transport system permease protein